MLNRNYKNLSLWMMLISFVAYSSVECTAESLKSKSTINQKSCSVVSSKPMLKFENKVLVKVYDLLLSGAFGDEPASAEYQELGKEAQMALGIPDEFQVPIKKFPQTLCSFPASAFAVPGAIYVNEDRLKSETYGAKRSAIFHEAVHKKYNDISVNTLIEAGSLFGSALLMNKLLYFTLNPSKWISYPLVIAAAVSGMYLAGVRYSKFMERRADIEGHFATQCSECVQESATRRRYMFETEKNPLQKNGYLFADALEQIAQELKAENKLCPHHNATN